MYAEHRLEGPATSAGSRSAPSEAEVARVVLAAVREAGTRGISVADLAADVRSEVDVDPVGAQRAWFAPRRSGRVTARLDPGEGRYRIYAA